MGREEALRVATVMFSVGQKAVWPLCDASIATIKIIEIGEITMLVQIKIKHCFAALTQCFANKHTLLIRMIHLEGIRKRDEYHKCEVVESSSILHQVVGGRE